MKRCHHDLAYLQEKAEYDISKVASLAQRYLDSYGGDMANPVTYKYNVN